MRKFNIKHQQLVSQSDSQAKLQSLDVAASGDIIASPDSHKIKSVSPMTYSQKLYQSQTEKIAEEFEEALEANSLEKIKRLLDKVLELNWTEG